MLFATRLKNGPAATGKFGNPPSKLLPFALSSQSHSTPNKHITMSGTQDLQWLLTRKTSSHIVKQKGLGRIFSREPGNLMNLHSYKYGWVNDKAVGIDAAANGKGITVTTKKSKAGGNKIAGARSVQHINRGGSRRSAGAVANIVAKRGYRADLLKGESWKIDNIESSRKEKKN